MGSLGAYGCTIAAFGPFGTLGEQFNLAAALASAATGFPGSTSFAVITDCNY
jgi:hypothetical protein